MWGFKSKRNKCFKMCSLRENSFCITMILCITRCVIVSVIRVGLSNQASKARRPLLAEIKNANHYGLKYASVNNRVVGTWNPELIPILFC